MKVRLLLLVGLFMAPLVVNAQNSISSDEPPALFQFLLDSDYVVVTSRSAMKAIGKRDKKLNAGGSYNFEDALVGSEDTFQIEELLFARNSFLSGEPLNSNTILSFEVYRTLGDRNQPSQNNAPYLLFIKEIPKTEDIFKTLELDVDKTYYRIYIGNQSIFPEPGDPMHGPYKAGMINLSAGDHPKVANEIRKLCNALNPGDKQERLGKLAELTKSNDHVLRENAEYAIKYLSQKKQQ